MPVLHRHDVVVTSNRYVIGEDDIVCDPTTGLPMASWSKQGTVVNKVDIKYDFNVTGLLPNTFARGQVYTADASVLRYTAQASLLAEFRGLRTATGGQAVLDRFALLFLQRWGYPPPILLCSVTFRRHLFEFLDTVYVSHPLIPNPESGTLGLDQARFEVLTVSPQFLDPQGRPNGRLDLALIWVEAIETSAVPVSSGALSLIPGESTVDATDVDVPLAASATVTTPGPTCSQIRIGLKALNFRTWSCQFDYSRFGGDPPHCEPRASVWNSHLYNSQITYHIEFKTNAAPNSPGSGSDPTTGWVTLLASTVRGNTSLISSYGCTEFNGQGVTPPSEDVWTHIFPAPGFILAAAPAVYNVKVFFDSLVAAANTCAADGSGCGDPECPDVYTGSTVLSQEVQRMTIDFIQGIA